MSFNMNCVLGAVLTAWTALASPMACVDGTVTSYLGAAPCSFSPGSQAVGPGTLQLTGFVTTFGLPLDQTQVRMTYNGDFGRLILGNGNFTSWTGSGTVSLQMTFDLPHLGGGMVYLFSEEAQDGCCTRVSFASDSFTGGLLTTSYLVSVVSGTVTSDWSYSFGSVNLSGHSGPDSITPTLAVVNVWLPHAQMGSAPANVPEPGGGALIICGLLCLAHKARGASRPSFCVAKRYRRLQTRT